MAMNKQRVKKAGPAPRHLPPIPVRAVDFGMYCAKNMRRTRSFYQKLFGFKRGGEWNEGWSEFTTEPVTFCLDGPAKGQAKSIWHGAPAIAFAVKDIHAAIAEGRRLKGKILIPPIETSVCWMAFIRDPDGNRICLHQRKDGTAG